VAVSMSGPARSRLHLHRSTGTQLLMAVVSLSGTARSQSRLLRSMEVQLPSGPMSMSTETPSMLPPSAPGQRPSPTASQAQSQLARHHCRCRRPRRRPRRRRPRLRPRPQRRRLHPRPRRRALQFQEARRSRSFVSTSLPTVGHGMLLMEPHVLVQRLLRSAAHLAS